jgi:hypothetical protein
MVDISLLHDGIAAGPQCAVGTAYTCAEAHRAQAFKIKRLLNRHTPCLERPITQRSDEPPSPTMFDMIAGLCIALLLVTLYAVRRHARLSRRRRAHIRARPYPGRTLSARTEMRAYSNATSTLGILKKRSRHA